MQGIEHEVFRGGLDTLVLMPPLSMTEAELARLVEALRFGILEVCAGR